MKQKTNKDHSSRCDSATVGIMLQKGSVLGDCAPEVSSATVVIMLQKDSVLGDFVCTQSLD